jgi:hypothetical protein
VSKCTKNVCPVRRTMIELLDVVWGDREGYGELRLMKDGVVDQSFFEWPDERDVIEAHVELFDDHDIYYGVTLRTRKSGKAADCEPSIHWLWADVDKKSGATFSSLLSAPVPPPQIVVDSGHGWHLYWRLAAPVTHAVAQDAMAAIASQIGGDAVGDPARILRLPDTWNLKGDPPIRVRIIRWKNLDHGWRLGDFDLRRAERRGRASTSPTGTRGTRSEELFVLAMDMVRKGASDADIVDAMLTHPAGSKVTEMPKARADKWMSLTIKKVRKLLS